MSLKGAIRDSWDVWRAKVNAAIGSIDSIDASDVDFDKTGTSLDSTNVEDAIKELDSNDGTLATAVSGISDRVTSLEGKGFKLTSLFNGDASTGGSEGVSVETTDITTFDDILLFYNLGAMSGRIPAYIFKNVNHHFKIQVYEGGSTFELSIEYIDDTHITIKASQGATAYCYGVKYHA